MVVHFLHYCMVPLCRLCLPVPRKCYVLRALAVAAKCALLAEVTGAVRYNHLLALQNASAKPGGVIALKSASVCGCAHASCGISACADLCRYAKLGLPRPGRVYSGNLSGTPSQLLYSFLGGTNLPHIAVRFVHGSPYSHG